MAPRIWKLSGFTLLVTFCLAASSCSISKISRPVDVTGYGPIKWGMTLQQVKSILGPKAEQLATDPGTGQTAETVNMLVGDMEFSGFVSAEKHTGRVNGVHLLYQNGLPIKGQRYQAIRALLIKDFGAPSKEHSGPSSTICIWGFPSGNILLMSYANQYVTLSYLQNPTGTSPQMPLQN